MNATKFMVFIIYRIEYNSSECVKNDQRRKNENLIMYNTSFVMNSFMKDSFHFFEQVISRNRPQKNQSILYFIMITRRLSIKLQCISIPRVNLIIILVFI